LHASKLIVSAALEELQDRDSIGELQTKRVDKVINDDNVLEVSIGNDAQVFDKEPILGFHAIPSMQQSMDSLAFLVQVGHNWLSVGLSASCEHIN
jgi:hypothetical protein